MVRSMMVHWDLLCFAPFSMNIRNWYLFTSKFSITVLFSRPFFLITVLSKPAHVYHHLEYVKNWHMSAIIFCRFCVRNGGWDHIFSFKASRGNPISPIYGTIESCWIWCYLHSQFGKFNISSKLLCITIYLI